jgi:dTDP-3-amino-3,4,6-trideoxy-alpha-D-glucose transaminase
MSPEDVAEVPFVDLDRSHDRIAAELRGAYEDVAGRGDFILGAAVEVFEQEFATFLGAGECMGVASGTAALALGLGALGIGPGDEVIVPAHTYIASALAVRHVGAEPVLCDVDPETGLIDLASAADAISERTAALMVVHLYGQACDMDAATELADRCKIALVEDAAQAHGARWRGRRVGSFGAIGAFSFYPSKNLGALGDGGAVVTSDAAVAGRVRQLRNLGQRAKGEHVVLGFNERLDTLQAAFLAVKLPHLDDWNRQRRDAAAAYDRSLPAGVRRLPAREEAEDVFHLYPVRLGERDSIADRLRSRGIGVGLHYHPAVHEHPPLAGARTVSVGEAESWAREELSLPMFPGLSESEVGHVARELEEALG